ncbi:MAG: N-acetyl-gamma-glutamyl-phosphate reductase [Deltaproteobacteria bacterium]|nr:MAG: N-acetyl-gamma-glutamyl-phosphate reductase [Deltaproteobacteria bacterium]
MRVAVVGASGYTGLELLRILLRHPDAELVAVTSEQRAGRPVGEAFPSLRGLTELRFEAADPVALAKRAEVAFTALPHAASAPVVRELYAQGVVVADLSADFRLRDPELYAKWYGAHPAPELLDAAVYGIPELTRDALRGTQLIAAAGCYPTSVLLPLVPFLREGLLALDRTLFVDSKSGVSGAGRTLAEEYLFAEVDGSCRAYKVGGVHRHLPEMEQEASAAARAPVSLTFVPHLLPAIRGIVTSVFAQPLRPLSADDARGVLEAAYADEPFVRVLPPGETPRIAAVRGSNFCDVAAFADAGSGALVLLSALDNLVKGAGGQAVQCVNLNRGLPETAGLLEAPLVP